MTDHPILIIGAGIGGLSAVLALQRIGHRVALYEVATDLAEVGAELTITPDATPALESLGLGERLAELADIPDGGTVRHYRTAKLSNDTKPRGNTARIMF